MWCLYLSLNHITWFLADLAALLVAVPRPGALDSGTVESADLLVIGVPLEEESCARFFQVIAAVFAVLHCGSGVLPLSVNCVVGSRDHIEIDLAVRKSRNEVVVRVARVMIWQQYTKIHNQLRYHQKTRDFWCPMQ